MVSTLIGVTITLSFLLLSAQALVHLYAQTAMSAAAYDAARLASAYEPMSPAQAAAHGRSVLGSFAPRVQLFEVTVGTETVRARVTADSPALLPTWFGRLTGLRSIDREVVVRRERMACADC